jgi:inorganic pyrophosphatase
MPLGSVFPFNFGFVPSTRGGDGDPLDVLLLTDFVLPTGALILGKLIAVLEAEQVDRNQKQRNDRLIAIPVGVRSHEPMLPVVAFSSGPHNASWFSLKNPVQNGAGPIPK